MAVSFSQHFFRDTDFTDRHRFYLQVTRKRLFQIVPNIMLKKYFAVVKRVPKTDRQEKSVKSMFICVLPKVSGGEFGS
jgi:hypothetical protein